MLLKVRKGDLHWSRGHFWSVSQVKWKYIPGLSISFIEIDIITLTVSTVLLHFPAATTVTVPELLYSRIHSPQTYQIQFPPILEETSIGQCVGVIP